MNELFDGKKVPGIMGKLLFLVVASVMFNLVWEWLGSRVAMSIIYITTLSAVLIYEGYFDNELKKRDKK